jgi:hypothetical protein
MRRCKLRYQNPHITNQALGTRIMCERLKMQFGACHPPNLAHLRVWSAWFKVITSVANLCWLAASETKEHKAFPSPFLSITMLFAQLACEGRHGRPQALETTQLEIPASQGERHASGPRGSGCCPLCTTPCWHRDLTNFACCPDGDSEGQHSCGLERQHHPQAVVALNYQGTGEPQPQRLFKPRGR